LTNDDWRNLVVRRDGGVGTGCAHIVVIGAAAAGRVGLKADDQAAAGEGAGLIQAAYAGVLRMGRAIGRDPIPGAPTAAGIAQLKGSNGLHLSPTLPVVPKRACDVIRAVAFDDDRVAFPRIQTVAELVAGL